MLCVGVASIGLLQDTTEPSNLLRNPNLNEGEANWNVGFTEPAAATGAVVNGAYCTTVTSSGENPWSVALRQSELGIETGETYTLGFEAFLLEGGLQAQVGVKIGQASEPYSEYFYEARALSSEPQTLSFSFEARVDDPQAQLELFMGGALTNPPVTLCFDMFYLATSKTQGNERTIPYIMVDQFGYLPNAPKVAVLVDPQEGFNAADEYVPGGVLELKTAAGNEVVFSGSPEVWNGGEVQATSGDRGWWFDFSEIGEPGNY